MLISLISFMKMIALSRRFLENSVNKLKFIMMVFCCCLFLLHCTSEK